MRWNFLVKYPFVRKVHQLISKHLECLLMILHLQFRFTKLKSESVRCAIYQCLAGHFYIEPCKKMMYDTWYYYNLSYLTSDNVHHQIWIWNRPSGNQLCTFKDKGLKLTSQGNWREEWIKVFWSNCWAYLFLMFFSFQIQFYHENSINRSSNF